MKYSGVQMRVLKEVYESDGGIVLTGVHKRTVEVLARDRLVTYEYLPPSTRRGCDNIKVSKVLSPRLASRAVSLIESQPWSKE